MALMMQIDMCSVKMAHAVSLQHNGGVSYQGHHHNAMGHSSTGDFISGSSHGRMWSSDQCPLQKVAGQTRNYSTVCICLEGDSCHMP